MPREPAGPAIWHRRFGIFVARGPGIKRDERVYGASLLDIAPTILSLYGLPIGDDMDGRVLSEIFEEEPTIQRIPSWDDVAGDSGMHSAEIPLDPGAAEDLLKQFVALGYIDDPGGDKQEQEEAATIEGKYNLARNYSWLKMYDEAIPLLDDLVRRRPWENRFILELVENYHSAGYVQHASSILESAFVVNKTTDEIVRFVWAGLQISLGNVDQALDVLYDLEHGRTSHPGLFNRIAQLYLQCRKFDLAEAAFKRALAVHPENADAHVGLSTIYRHQRKNQQAADEALAAVGLIYRLPQAHFDLGVALARAGDYSRAIMALKTALKFGPRMVNAHRWLAMIYRSALQDPTQADFHARQVRRPKAAC